MNNKTALITGASKGIGKEFARIHASKGGNLVLVARNKELLESLKIELMEHHSSIHVEIIVKDLSKQNSVQEIYNELKDKSIQIDYLINNAGFGDYGFFVEKEWDRYEQMIDLNVKSLTHLCHLFLPDMIKRKSGKILNVSSTAAFQPGPMMAVYFATKSYVLHFSEALNNEAKQSNVSVTAFCPGPTDTYFMEDSQMGKSKFIKNKSLPSAHAVALSGYKAMLEAKPVRIHGFMNKLTAFSVRLVPRRWVVSILRKMQE